MLLPFRLAPALIATALPTQQIAPAANGLTATTGNTTLQIFPGAVWGERHRACARPAERYDSASGFVRAGATADGQKNVDPFYPKDIYGHADMDELMAMRIWMS